MAKKKEQIVISKQKIFNIILSIVVAATALIAATTAQRLNDESNALAYGNFVQNRTVAYNHAMLEFCYEHGVHPCDEVAIEQWNDAHPDTIFPIRTPAQLGDEKSTESY